MTPLDLQDHINSMPLWRSAPIKRAVERPLTAVGIVIDFPRQESVIFKSGGYQIKEAYTKTLKSDTLASKDGQSPCDLLPKQQLTEFSNGLQKLGIPHDKVLIHGLWDMRTAFEMKDESDEDSCSSSDGEGEEGDRSGDSDEEL